MLEVYFSVVLVKRNVGGDDSELFQPVCYQNDQHLHLATFAEGDGASIGDSVVDTVTLAQQERQKHELYETEISYGGEADLRKSYSACTKNHDSYIPVHRFNIQALPIGYRDLDLMSYITAIAELTVRITVKYISEKRPKTVPGSDKPYLNYDKRGRHMLTVGTGLVYNVYKFHNMDNIVNRSCRCQTCQHSRTPEKQFAEFGIITAAHVVFDETEAAQTTCHLFFDKGGIPSTRKGVVVALEGMAGISHNMERDWCVLTYITHDLTLADRLLEIIHRRDEIMKSLTNKHRQSMLARRNGDDRSKDASGEHQLVVIVSHPHGTSKQISVGYSVKTDRAENGWKSYRYNTATCPGSSGAYVFQAGPFQSVSWASHMHSGNCPDQKEYNYSCVGLKKSHSEQCMSKH